MKKYTIVICLMLFILFSCKTSNIGCDTIKTGKYLWASKKVPSYKYELLLNNDSTFTFFQYEGVKSTCSGTWKCNNKEIIISCWNEYWTNQLARGYLNNRVQNIKIIGKNKLKLPIFNNVKRKYVILERIENEEMFPKE